MALALTLAAPGFAVGQGAPAAPQAAEPSRPEAPARAPGGLDVRAFGAAGVVAAGTGSVEAGSATLRLREPGPWRDGQGIRVDHAGAAFAYGAPSGLAVAPCGRLPASPQACKIGATTYRYAVASLDGRGGVGAAVAPVATAAGPSTLDARNYVSLTWTAPSPAPPAYVVYGRSGDALAPLAIVNGPAFRDFGEAGVTGQTWLPPTPPPAPLASWLVARIAAGAGSTTLTLSAPAGAAAADAPVHADDALAFQEAVAAAGAGGVVLVPPGTYPINPGGFALAPGVALVGAGRGSTALRATGSLQGSDLLRAEGAGGAVRELTLDGGGHRSAELNALIGCHLCSGLAVADVALVGWDRFGISINGGQDVDLRRLLVARATVAPTQNQAVLASCSAGPPRRLRIADSRFVNSALDVCGLDVEVVGNLIAGWGFGGGVTTEVDPGSAGARIVDNTITGGVGYDVNDTAPLGIENWAPRSLISGNVIYGNAGDGIANGGANSVVSGNVVYDNGRGIVARHSSPTVNGNGTIYSGNRAYDSRGREGVQDYGYYEENASVAGNTLEGNDFSGNKVGPALRRGPPGEGDPGPR